MRKVNGLILGLVISMGLSSCMKDPDVFDHDAQYEIEKPQIEMYALAQIPGATFHEGHGIWYQLIRGDESDFYEYKIVNSNIEAPVLTVKYKGQLLNGTVFDDKSNVAEGVKLSLGNTILAWQIAFLPKEIDGQEIGGLTMSGLQKGDRIRFVTPSRWGYQHRGQGAVPANAPLDFEIEVLDIEAPGSGAN